MFEDAEERQAILASIVDSSEDAIISKNLNSIITSWNKAAERMFGYKEDEMIGQHVAKLIPTDRLQEEDMIIGSLKLGKRVEHYETIRVTKTGRQIQVSITVSPLRNSAGIITGASKIARDITKQKEAERISHQYAQRLEIINETGRAISAELEVDELLQKVTDATTKLSGAAFGAFFYNKTDANGETLMLYALSGAPREAFDKLGMPRNTAIFSKTFNGEGIFRSDDITKDPRYGKNSPYNGMPRGHLPVVSYLAVPVSSPSGVVIGGLFFGHPEVGVFKKEHEMLVVAIASQAAIALENAKLYEEIRALNSKKDEFIGFASHELKTPLTTITGYLQLAEKKPDLAKNFIPRISKQITRLTAIISDLLDLSRIQSGRLELNISQAKLNNVVYEAIETIRSLSPGHVLKINLPQEEIVVEIDSQKISQVIINVLTNAFKYAPEQTTVTIDAIRLGDEIRISIEDEGRGIPEADIEKIFTRFYRVKSRGQTAQGLGLGLYLSREIMEGHRGNIWAESEEGKGTVFFIEFPIAVTSKY